MVDCARCGCFVGGTGCGCSPVVLDVPEASKIVLDCYAAATAQTVRRILDDLRAYAETAPDEISPGLDVAIRRIGGWEWYPKRKP